MIAYNPNEKVSVQSLGVPSIGVPKLPFINIFGRTDRAYNISGDDGDGGIVKGKTIIVTATTDSVIIRINTKNKTFAVTPNKPTKIVIEEDVTSLWYAFYGLSSLVAIDLSNLDTSKVTNYLAIFNNCHNLYTLNMTGWDLSNVNSLSFENCYTLTDLRFGKNYKKDLYLGYSPLSHASALSVINGLAQVTTPKTITFNSTTYNTLTEEEIALATSKGFNIASA